jgi:hypothetical protein
MACSCPQGCVVNPIFVNWVGYSSFDIRRRTGYSAGYGVNWGTHSATAQSWTFDPKFHAWLGDVVKYINTIAVNHATKAIDWIGCAGVGGVCDDKPYHSTGRAMDITAIRFTDGSVVDCNASWAVMDRYNNRLYAALIAAARIYAGPSSVLSAGYDSMHSNHVHVDNWWPGGPLKTSDKGDRVLLRRINQVFGASSNAVDTRPWNDRQDDSAATAATVAALRLPSCWQIFTNAWHTLGFLDLVARHGIANRPPGYFAPHQCA